MDVPAGKFKATCLELMDRVAATGEEVIITKRGKVVAKLVAATREQKKAKSVFGCMKDSILHSAPDRELFSTRTKWNANSEG